VTATAELSITDAGIHLTVVHDGQAHLSERLGGRDERVVVAQAAKRVLAAAGWSLAGPWRQTVGGITVTVFEAEVAR
jgi:hypothetical protein